MSKFTTELRYIVESGIDIFPVSPFSEMTISEYNHFKDHFIKHFYTREIGFETVGLFVQKLEAKLYDLADKYDDLFKVKHKELDFFSTDYTSITNGTTNSNGTNRKTGSINSSNTNSNNSLNLMSDTPQGAIDINTNDYVTSIQKAQDNGNNTNITNYNNLMDTLQNNSVNNVSTHVFGNTDNRNIERLVAYKKAVMQLENEMLRECNSLFMYLW